MQYRRNDYDVTNTVQVSSPEAVRRAVRELYAQAWPYFDFTPLDTAFTDFERLFRGQYPGYHGCDTAYHDIQHSLDGTLAAARLCVSYDQLHQAPDRIGPERAMLCVVCALFHDSGYIREINDTRHRNGAELTRNHVSRSATFLARYLRTLGMAAWIPVATQIVHFTGYEMRFDQIHLDSPLDRITGYLLGTADLIAQMSDRCYLEKCRDRLYPEFILAGIAVSKNDEGEPVMRYNSGLDILRSTPEFVNGIRRTHLDGEFGGVYRVLEALFGGRNPYIEAIEAHLHFLDEVLRTERWPMLRRDPPCFTDIKNPVQSMRALALDKLKDLWAKP